jgi:hypothetical protein
MFIEREVPLRQNERHTSDAFKLTTYPDFILSEDTSILDSSLSILPKFRRLVSVTGTSTLLKTFLPQKGLQAGFGWLHAHSKR